MRRRDVLAGLASAGVLAGGGAIAVYGLPSLDGLDEDGPADGETGASESGDGESDAADPVELETIDAPGSEAGTVAIPTIGEPTFIDLFGTWCPPCIEQMPALAEAHERIGDEVQFVSVTSEPVTRDHGISEAELAEWWGDHDGNWTVAADPTARVVGRYYQGAYPTAVAFDADGRLQWAESGVKSTDELVSRLESVLDSESDATGEH